MMQTTDGAGRVTPIPDMKKRGHRLNDGDILGLRDLCYALLLGMGLSPADAIRVMTGKIDRSQVWRRQRELVPVLHLKGVFPLMEEIARGARDAG